MTAHGEKPNKIHRVMSVVLAGLGVSARAASQKQTQYCRYIEGPCICVEFALRFRELNSPTTLIPERILVHVINVYHYQSCGHLELVCGVYMYKTRDANKTTD